jgi:hypothetical protein
MNAPALEPCPMGCGQNTDDPYGGPCSACWNRLDADLYDEDDE